MSWQDKYHHNLDLGMSDNAAFDDAVEQQMAEDETIQYDKGWALFEQYVEEQLKAQRGEEEGDAS